MGAFAGIFYIYQEGKKWQRRRQGQVGDEDLASVEGRLLTLADDQSSTLASALEGLMLELTEIHRKTDDIKLAVEQLERGGAETHGS